MTNKELKDRFANLNIWQKGDQRAPHKPLVLLTALSALQRTGNSELSYKEEKDRLIQLLKDFGPQRQTYHPEQPFARLANDKNAIWEINGNQPIDTKNPNSKILSSLNATGKFKKEIENHLLRDSDVLKELAQMILDEHFPTSIHEDIIDAIGLNMSIIKSIRDPNFRRMIMIAYERKCAVCNFNIQLGETYIGLDAAHIKWKKAQGPDTENNGILLCTMHHKLFDRGAFTLNNKMEIMVSKEAHGTYGFKEWLMDYHGKRVRLPQSRKYYPEIDFTNWHVREVFHGSYRD